MTAPGAGGHRFPSFTSLKIAGNIVTEGGGGRSRQAVFCQEWR